MNYREQDGGEDDPRRIDEELQEDLVMSVLGENVARALGSPDDNPLKALLKAAKNEAIMALPLILQADLYSEQGLGLARRSQNMLNRYVETARWIANALENGVVASERIESYMGIDDAEAELADRVNGRQAERATD